MAQSGQFTPAPQSPLVVQPVNLSPPIAVAINSAHPSSVSMRTRRPWAMPSFIGYMLWSGAILLPVRADHLGVLLVTAGASREDHPLSRATIASSAATASARSCFCKSSRTLKPSASSRRSGSVVHAAEIARSQCGQETRAPTGTDPQDGRRPKWAIGAAIVLAARRAGGPAVRG
jgi:hypothetical protein